MKQDEIGRFLCYVLRHKPDAVPMFSVDANGWGLLKNLTSKNISKQHILDAVATDEKGRFEVKETIQGPLIRCVYGHSLPHVNIQDATPNELPECLYHGTTQKAYNNIMKDGLKPMTRREVCLTSDISVAISNGMRYAKNVENLVVVKVENLSKIDGLRQVGVIWCCNHVSPDNLSYLDISNYHES